MAEEIRNKKGQFIKAVAQNTNKNGTAGRPTVMTPETISKLEEVFAIGGSDEEACFYAGIGKTTLYNYQQDNPEFVERKEALKEKPILKARQTIVKGLDDVHNAQWYLEKKKKNEFGNAASIEIKDMTELEKHKESLRLLLEQATNEIDESANTKDTNKEAGENN